MSKNRVELGEDDPAFLADLANLGDRLQHANLDHLYHDDEGQRVGQVMEDAHRELGTHLTPAQVAKLEQMRKRHEHFRRYRREGRHPPPPEAP